jgi:hypothetical protein
VLKVEYFQRNPLEMARKTAFANTLGQF